MDVADWLGAEPLIAARLGERLADLPQVRLLTATDLAALEAGSVPTPSVHIICHGDTAVRPLGAGHAADIGQTWLAVVCIRNVAGDLRSGTAARQDAGPLICRVARALMGWSPGAGYQALEMCPAPWKMRYLSGRLFVPLAFTTGFRIHREEP